MWRFHRAGELPWRDAVRFAIPAIVGATAGASLASVFDNVRTAELLTFAIVAAFIILLANPGDGCTPTGPIRSPTRVRWCCS